MELKFAEFRTLDESAVLTLKRPPLNILNQAMCEELTEFLTKLPQEVKFKRLFLVSEQKCFSAGADIDEHLPGRVETMLPKFHELLLTLASFPIPTIAVVSGNCLGGGLELARACSWVVALNANLKGIKLGVPEIGLGCFPPFALALLPRLGGDLAATIRFLLTGQILSFSDEDPSSEPACQMGLINEGFRGTLERFFLDFEEMSSESRKMENVFRDSPRSLDMTIVLDSLEGEAAIKTINSLSRQTLSWAIETLIDCSQAIDLKTALAMAEKIYLEELTPHPDYLEGLTAFKEKRPPVWQETGHP